MLFQGTVLLCLALQVAASPYRPQARLRPVATSSAACPTGSAVHIIGIRGTMEKEGYGELASVVASIKKELPNSTDEAIDYPAGGITKDPDTGNLTFDFLAYRGSEQTGVDKIEAALMAYNEVCPESGIVLMGYSQGAHAIGDGICGRYGSILFPRANPIDDYYTYNVRAIIQLGDPTNRYDVDWHVGSSTKNGLFPRLDYRACRRFGDVWQSYCDENDFFCSWDPDATFEVHLGYVKKYASNITDFVVEKSKEAVEELQVHKFSGSSIVTDTGCNAHRSE